MIPMAVLFWAVAALSVAGALGVVFSPRPVHAVLSLLAVMFALAVGFSALGSPILAAMQIIVYAGAVVVLFLFVVMLLDIGAVLPAFRGAHPVFVVLTVGGVLGLTGALVATLTAGGLPPAAGPPAADPSAFGWALFTRHLALFLLVGILLTAAAEGVVGLTRRERP